MSKPLRLVRQAAQAAEFRCPLCDGAHAAYIFGTREFRIYRCAGCALTFSQPMLRSAVGENRGLAPQRRRPDRREQNHQGLIAAVDAAKLDGPVVVICEPDDAIVGLIE